MRAQREVGSRSLNVKRRNRRMYQAEHAAHNERQQTGALQLVYTWRRLFMAERMTGWIPVMNKSVLKRKQTLKRKKLAA